MRTVFSGGTVFDGTGAAPSPGEVVVEDGRIVGMLSLSDVVKTALASAITALIDEPDERARLAEGASRTSVDYDITTFVRKMEQLYVLLHRESRATGRRVAETADLSFLTRKAPA